MMITNRQVEALRLVALGNSIDQVAELLQVSRSNVEKLLANAKDRLSARTLSHAIYLAAKTGIIIWCCVAILDADEVRRVNRCGRREMIAVQAVI